MGAGFVGSSSDLRGPCAAVKQPLPNLPVKGILLRCCVRLQHETRAEFAHSTVWDQGHIISGP